MQELYFGVEKLQPLFTDKLPSVIANLLPLFHSRSTTVFLLPTQPHSRCAHTLKETVDIEVMVHVCALSVDHRLFLQAAIKIWVKQIKKNVVAVDGSLAI